MSSSLLYLVEMLQRAKDGPPMTDQRWDREIVPNKIAEYLNKYDLIGSFNPDTPVNQDLELADRFFAAGLELAAEIGMFCVDTESVINVTKQEIVKAITAAPDHLVLGEGEDQVIIRTRHPEDKTPPVFTGPLSIQVDEELYVPITAGILKSPKIRVQEGPSLDTVFGYPVYSGTPYETVVALLENRLREQAQWLAGRPGMPNSGIASSTTEYGNLGGYPGLISLRKPSLALILHPAELKIHYASFHKAASAIGYGGYIDSGSYSMIGGFSGGAEGAALSGVATDLLQFAVLHASMTASTLYDVRYDSTCGRHGLWATSIVCQAIGRNSHLLTSKIINQLAGPCTEEILTASSAGYITAGVSGLSYTVGPRSAGGRFKNYLTPLEHWFCADVFEASADLTLGQANEIVLSLLEMYENSLKNPPKGKSFLECFNPKTLEPTDEWQKIADKVRDFLARKGLSWE